MGWQRKAGDEHNHIDGRTHTHNIHLFNDVTGGEHNIHIRLGVDSCPHCKRTYSKDDLGVLDPRAIVEQEMVRLHANHAAIMAYAEKHGVPIKVGQLATSAPEGHKHVQSGGQKMLKRLK